MKESLSARPIQWFPGHMTKTLRLMEKDIRNVDAVLQLLDARIPRSSLNPEIARITAGKPHLYVLNKADNGVPKVHYTYCSIRGKLFNCTCCTKAEAQRLCEDWLVKQDRCYIN